MGEPYTLNLGDVGGFDSHTHSHKAGEAPQRGLRVFKVRGLSGDARLRKATRACQPCAEDQETGGPGMKGPVVIPGGGGGGGQTEKDRLQGPFL